MRGVIARRPERVEVVRRGAAVVATRPMPARILAVTLLLALTLPAAARARPRALACPEGRFLAHVHTSPLRALTLEVLLPSGLRGGVPLAVIAGGAPAAYTLDGDVVRFALPPAPGAPVAWRIAATP
jgi:hypothetical protein